MSKTLDNIRLNLCFFSGEDDYIIRKCSREIQMSFAFIGAFVIAIFIGCFISAFEFSISVFNESLLPVIPFFIALVWAFLVVNLYLLLLYTISPPLLPVGKNRKKNIAENIDVKSDGISVSLILRLLLITLLAIVITQPLSVFHLADSIDKQLQEHKNLEQALMVISFDSTSIKNQTKVFSEFDKQMKTFKSEYPLLVVSSERLFEKLHEDSENLSQIKIIQDSLSKKKSIKISQAFYDKKRDSLKSELITISNQFIDSDADMIQTIDNINSASTILNSAFLVFRNEIKTIIQHRNDNHIRISNAINESNYYSTKIKLLLQYNPLSWLLTFLICLIFIVPIYLKFAMRNLSEKFFKDDFKGQHTIYRIRDEIINTTDFAWLKSNLLKLKIDEIKTSDFYFQKMLIEYRIILQDYEEFKATHSQILKMNVESYDKIYKARVNEKLELLKKINLEKYKDFLSEIENEFTSADDSFEKFEYWEDAPFRTLKRKISSTSQGDEDELLQLVYANLDKNNIEL